MNLKAPVSSLMAIDILTAGVDAPAHALREQIREHGYHHLPVVDDRGILLGILSHVDLARADGEETTAAELMYEAPAVIRPDAPLAMAVAILAGGVFHALPVVDDEGGLCGLLTTSDLMRAWLAEQGHALYGADDVGDEAPLIASVDLADDDLRNHYDQVLTRIDGLLLGETDWVCAMATVACELHHAFDYFDWTGFYRAVDGETLAVGPYQGGHGCLRIDLARGVCGAAARSRQTQLVPDVDAFPGHIACSATTASELAVPIVTPAGRLLAVLDVDSDTPAAFGDVDREALEALAATLGARFGG